MKIRSIAVIGSGNMGNGIAQVCATAGYLVFMRDVEQRFLDRAMENITRSLSRLVKAGKIAESQVAEIKGRITPTTDLEVAVRDASLVIEAIPEDLELKKQLFAELDRLTRPDCILASNTSNFSITAIASATKRTDRVVGMHWFNPPPVMRLIEIVRGFETSDETIQFIQTVSETLGKETVVCKDAQGFITTRAVVALTLEAYRMLEEGIATREDIDKAIRLGLNHPMGPLELADLTGQDVTLHVAEAMSHAYGDRFKPTNTLRNLVRAGRYGRKVGKGIYDYEGK